VIKVSTIGVPLSGNKGSSSMLLSIIQNFRIEIGDVFFNIYTYYPKIDKRKNRFSNARILSGTPLNLLLRIVPISFLYFIWRKVGLKLPEFILGREIRALLNSDLYLAVGGTTFSDAKLHKVIFNVLCLLPAKLLKLKLVLYTQTMGPFNHPFNRIIARWILRYADLIIGRGKGSFEHLKRLGLKKIDFAMDGAFSLESDGKVGNHIVEKYAPLFKGRTIVGISPNSIVEGYCKKYNINHAQVFGNFINFLIEREYLPVLIPYSMKPDSNNRHNNDLPVINNILKYVNRKGDLIYVKEDYSFLELRALIGLTDFYVASRFHSMISALYMKRPVLVFGWGYHKYNEVMDEFELSDYIFSFNNISKNNLIEGFEKIVRDKDFIKKKIDKNLPRVIGDSKKAVRFIKTIL